MAAPMILPVRLASSFSVISGSTLGFLKKTYFFHHKKKGKSL